jgi:hypothetical protein
MRASWHGEIRIDRSDFDNDFTWEVGRLGFDEGCDFTLDRGDILCGGQRCAREQQEEKEVSFHGILSLSHSENECSECGKNVGAVMAKIAALSRPIKREQCFSAWHA